jgi:hypothetical protein
MMVRDLTPTDAGALLVHSHIISHERRQALLFKRGPAAAYFTPEQQAKIRDWISKEDYLPQDHELEHPKRPTHWCAYCGHVESCEHDHMKPEISTSDRKLLAKARAMEKARARLNKLYWEIKESDHPLAEKVVERLDDNYSVPLTNVLALVQRVLKEHG